MSTIHGGQIRTGTIENDRLVTNPLARGNHTGTQTASTISDFAAAARAETEAEIVAGANITVTPSGSGASRQLTIAAVIPTDEGFTQYEIDGICYAEHHLEAAP